MNIRCPECRTLFRVADEKVGLQGVKFRCGRCKHVFVASRADAVPPARPPLEEAPPPAPPAPEPPPAGPVPPFAEAGPPTARAWTSSSANLDLLSIDFDAHPPAQQTASPPQAPPAAAPAPRADDEERTVFEPTPSWLGAAADGLDFSGAASGPAVPPWSTPIEPVAEREAPAPVPPSAERGGLRAEELFGEPTPEAGWPSAARPVVPTPHPQPAPRGPVVEAVTPRAGRPRPPPAPMARAAVEVRGWRAVLRVGFVLASLAAVFVLFVLWRSGWGFDDFGHRVARAFSGGGAEVGSQIPGLGVHGVRRRLYRNRYGEQMLVVSGEISNDTARPARSTSVLVRFVDATGVAVAERENLAVGLFDASVLAGFRDPGEVEQEYKKRESRSVIRPGGRLGFTIIFFPVPQEVQGRRLRMLVEVTRATLGDG